ncbi:MAG: DUF2470 domain-containing protein [Acidobacteriota bacterium]|nr:DUF2470 domain-containing protein [Acidobacteriota bacterium]
MTANDAHARPTRDGQEPLYDVLIATPSHAERARTLVARITTGTLCTVAVDPVGYPYGSFVTVAFDNGDPVFLVSTMAEHTRNLQQDPRASLLVAETRAEDPLANGRVTLIGRCSRVEGRGGTARDAFLATHPNAAYYVDFGDFAFWRLRVESIRYIGGYGRMSWVEADAWQAAEPDPLAPVADGIIAHMNRDHADTMVLYCRAFSKATELDAATMTGVDRYGFEMSAITKEGPRPVRVAFPDPVVTGEQVRAALVAMVHDAREILA